MKKLDFGQSLGLVANLGVVVGIVLLLVELNQNRDMMRAQIRHDISQELIDQTTRVSDNPELAALLIQDGCGQVTSCESVDDFRIDLYWGGRFRSWESLHYQYRAGLYDETEFESTKIGWGNILVIPNVADRWRRQRSSFSPEFVAEVDRLLPENRN